MCAIIDANAAHQAYGAKRTPAGVAFREWVDAGSARLVVGGKLLEELDEVGSFRDWRATAVQYGKLRVVEPQAVSERTAELRTAGSCLSDDEHVIALAQVSGARLFFTNESALQADFKTKALIDQPRGRVYSTKENPAFGRAHRDLLRNRTLCDSTRP